VHQIADAGAVKVRKAAQIQKNLLSPLLEQVRDAAAQRPALEGS